MPLPLSEQAETALREVTKEYDRTVADRAQRRAAEDDADVVSATHVHDAAQEPPRRRRRRYTVAVAVGGAVLGTGLSVDAEVLMNPTTADSLQLLLAFGLPLGGLTGLFYGIFARQ